MPCSHLNKNIDNVRNRGMKNVAKALALAVLIGSMGIAGCETTTEEEVGSDARRFTGSELRTYLADKTQVWPEGGGAYYAANGALQTLWQGERNSGTYSVSEDGMLCWHIAEWGEQPCETYYHDGDSVIIVYAGETLPEHSIHEGNILDNL